MQFNPRSPEFRANPYPIYHRLRTQDPVHYRLQQGDWLLTRHADIMAVLKDTRFGHSESLVSESSVEQNTHPLIRLRLESRKLLKLWLMIRNPPDHTRLRKLFHNTFAPLGVNSLSARINSITNELIDQVQTRGRMDIMRDLAYPLPLRVISEILGIPKEDQGELRKLARHLESGLDIDITAMAFERSNLAIIGFSQYFRHLAAKWHHSPPSQDNLITRMMQAQAEGQLSEEEFLAHCILMFMGGHSTTRHLIGTGMLAFLRHPDQLRLLQAQPSLIQTAINECLRYASPAQVVSRKALSDVVLASKTIRKGQMVHLILGAANRDPAQFRDPDKFDIRRRFNKQHLAFGYGIHYCLGAHLAQLESQIAIGTLVRRLPNLALPSQADSIEWEETFQVRGLKTFPVLF